MVIYNAFLSFESEGEGFPDLIEVEAETKEQAREVLAEQFRQNGFAAELSDTSEEVYFSSGGKEIVYYGFDEN